MEKAFLGTPITNRTSPLNWVRWRTATTPAWSARSTPTTARPVANWRSSAWVGLTSAGCPCRAVVGRHRRMRQSDSEAMTRRTGVGAGCSPMSTCRPECDSSTAARRVWMLRSQCEGLSVPSSSMPPESGFHPERCTGCRGGTHRPRAAHRQPPPFPLGSGPGLRPVVAEGRLPGRCHCLARRSILGSSPEPGAPLTPTCRRRSEAGRRRDRRRVDADGAAMKPIGRPSPWLDCDP